MEQGRKWRGRCLCLGNVCSIPETDLPPFIHLSTQLCSNATQLSPKVCGTDIRFQYIQMSIAFTEKWRVFPNSVTPAGRQDLAYVFIACPCLSCSPQISTWPLEMRGSSRLWAPCYPQNFSICVNLLMVLENKNVKHEMYQLTKVCALPVRLKLREDVMC